MRIILLKATELQSCTSQHNLAIRIFITDNYAWVRENKQTNKISWNSRSLEIAISACWLLVREATFNNRLLQWIQILKVLSYLGDEQVNRTCPTESYFIYKNYSFHTNSNILLFIPLKIQCRSCRHESPWYTQFLAILKHSIEVYYPTHKLVWSSRLKFTNTDITRKSGTGKNSVSVGCQTISFAFLLRSERSPDYNTTLTKLTE